MTMKQYTVYFSEPVKHTYTGDRFNKELKKWEGHLEELAVREKACPIPQSKESDSLIGGTG